MTQEHHEEGDQELMTEQQRETVARAIYQAYIAWHVSRTSVALTPWETLQESTRDMYRFTAESAYSAMRASQCDTEREQA